MKTAALKVKSLFTVRAGDFHALKELDPGNVPVISCGDGDNGAVGYFDIPHAQTYSRGVTVAFNGQPLTVKFHPYRFGAKDDVAVLVPMREMRDSTLLYLASLLNAMQWRYSYGRKCFQQKLINISLTVPVVDGDGEEGVIIDEDAIAHLLPKEVRDYIPSKQRRRVPTKPLLWKSVQITDILNLERGDFHSITALDDGEYMTVSRVTVNNGVVGYYERPDDAIVYGAGCITVSTVGGDTFVQLDDFIVTDNVIVCTPKKSVRLTTLFFIAYMLNFQKWRYGYGRQCYKAKLEASRMDMPVDGNGDLDEDIMEAFVKGTSYWPHVERVFAGVQLSETLIPKKATQSQQEQPSLPLTF